MQVITNLFNLAGGYTVEGEDDGPAKRARLLIQAAVATIVLAAIYGVAAGSTDATLALSNIYKMPMVILLSALCAVPAGLLTWRLLGARHKATDLLMGLASANFTAALVLAVLAPVVALYYHTSGYLGGTLAMGAVYLSLVVGLIILVRTVAKRVPKDVGRMHVAIPVLVIVGIQLATLVQFIYIASPILPEITVFDGGMDAIVNGG
ncbi:MAG TPA: hypothetical protein QGF58_01820 [Myxococcota bacterium]|nr:hypothetical protein [Myxococcota bacterium]